MGANTNDILGRPSRRPGAEAHEFWRQTIGMRQHMRNVGVDAIDERLRDGLRIGRRIRGPLRRHVAAIQKQSRDRKSVV